MRLTFYITAVHLILLLPPAIIKNTIIDLAG